jgi:hypothetical protein
MSDKEIQYNHNFDDLMRSLSVMTLKEDQMLEIGGKLGIEGQTFLNESHQEKIREDLKQAIHIKNFIRDSISEVKENFLNKEEELLEEFCDDLNIFQELEEKNQLDIKGKPKKTFGTIASKDICIFSLKSWPQRKQAFLICFVTF